jgi:hypothetical protein
MERTVERRGLLVARRAQHSLKPKAEVEAEPMKRSEACRLKERRVRSRLQASWSELRGRRRI